MCFVRVGLASLTLVGSLLAAAPRTACAQDPIPQLPPALRNPAVDEGIKIAEMLFGNPWHLTVAPVIATAGGVTVGVAYTPKPKPGNFLFTSMRTAISTKSYWIAEGGIGWQHRKKSRVELFGSTRQMTELEYYGLGPNTVLEDHAYFWMRDYAVGLIAWVAPHPRLKLGTRLEHVVPELTGGQSQDLPLVSQKYDDRSAPGLFEQPSYVHVQGSLDVLHPSRSNPDEAWDDYRITYGMFRGHTTGESQSFDRLELEAQQRFLLTPSRKITLHLWGSSTRPLSGARVPFYMMDTIGGAGTLRGYRDPMIGGDDTQGTLRGFGNFRFRDLNLLLMQAEYRQKLYGPIDLSLFADAGTVARRLADFHIHHLQTDYGFAVSFMQKRKTMVRIDFGFGGGEGLQMFFGVGTGQPR